jgi:uncharacterized repeat protein (TIGR02543 family)
MGTSKVTMTATYTINQYTLEYVDHDGSVLQTANYNYGSDLSAVSAPENPTKTGYTFDGWSGVVPLTMGTTKVTMTATYTINQYTISLNTSGGNIMEPLTGVSGEAVTAPSNPTRNGYSFTGWFIDLAKTTPYTFTEYPSENITVYAGWVSSNLSFALINLNTEYSVSRGTATGEIIIPSTYLGLPVTKIADNGFSRFGQTWVFTSISIPEGIKVIGQYGLFSIPFTSITLPSTLERIELGAFAFTSIKSIHIPANVSFISSQTFSASTYLETISVDPLNEWFTSQDGILYNKDMTKLLSFPPGSLLTTYTIPATVTMLEEYSIRQVSKIQSLIFQNGLVELKAYSISACSALVSVIIPISVTTMAASSVANNSNLIIYVEALSKPAGWSTNWNYSNRPVVWGYIID